MDPATATDGTDGAPVGRKQNLPLAGAGAVIAVGLALAIVRAIAQLDWLLGLAILLMVVGSWFAAFLVREFDRPSNASRFTHTLAPPAPAACRPSSPPAVATP